MLQTISYFIMLFLSIFLNLFNNPIIMGMILFLQTFMICMLLSMISKTAWFSYILFIVFVGGILILFIYMISLTYQKMNPSMNKSTIFTLLIMMIIAIILFKFMNLEENFIFNFNQKHLFSENMENLNKLYNFPNNFINILLINYLFFMLIITMKLTNFIYGPLRMK